MSVRSDKVAALIQKDLGGLISAMELEAMATISRVEVAPDLKHAKVGVTVFSDDQSVRKAVLAQLQGNIYELQGEINRRLTMKMVPRIRFVLDEAEQYAAHINELLRQVSEEDSKRQGQGPTEGETS